jgi:hypothetical protein
MKKPIIFAVIGFVVALAASTFLGIQKGKKAAAAAALVVAAHADSVKAAHAADSTANHDSTTKHDGGEHAEAPKDSGSTAGPGDAQVAHGEPAGPVPAKVIPVSTPINSAEKAEAFKQVARVLSAMKAADAVKVMAFLSDEEVEGILRAVGPRQAGDFLTNLPKERAATLSRRLLVPKPKAAQ